MPPLEWSFEVAFSRSGPEKALWASDGQEGDDARRLCEKFKMIL